MTAIGYLRGDQTEVIVCQGSALSYPRHNHVSTLTLGLVLEGALELATDRGTELCRENGLFALPPYMPHSLNARAPYTLVSPCVSKELAARGDPGEAREAGLTPHQFQLQNRVRKGQRLLGGPAPPSPRGALPWGGWR